MDAQIDATPDRRTILIKPKQLRVLLNEWPGVGKLTQPHYDFWRYYPPSYYYRKERRYRTRCKYNLADEEMGQGTFLVRLLLSIRIITNTLTGLYGNYFREHPPPTFDQIQKLK